MVTGEPGFAQIYARAEQILGNGIPKPPALLFPESFKTGLTTPVSFAWTPTDDPDGDPLIYRHCVWEVRKQFSLDDCVVVSNRVASVTWRNGILLAFMGCLASMVLIDTKKKPRLLGLVAMASLAMVSLGCTCGKKPVTIVDGKPYTKTVSDLEGGKAYYWKVIVEDGKGATVESETRRFEIK